jgi:hypothetical protein
MSLHPTRWAWNFWVYEGNNFSWWFESPSHPVGSELWNNRWEEVKKYLSPSHAVGLEQYKKLSVEVFQDGSPSHTVG